MPGPSTSRVTSTCLITWVVRFAPSTSTPSGSSRRGRRRSSTSTTARTSIAPITGGLTVPTAISAYWDSRPWCSFAPVETSWSTRWPLAVPTAVRARPTIASTLAAAASSDSRGRARPPAGAEGPAFTGSPSRSGASRARPAAPVRWSRPRPPPAARARPRPPGRRGRTPRRSQGHHPGQDHLAHGRQHPFDCLVLVRIRQRAHGGDHLCEGEGAVQGADGGGQLLVGAHTPCEAGALHQFDEHRV